MTFCDYYAELSGASKDIIDKLDILDIYLPRKGKLLILRLLVN